MPSFQFFLDFFDEVMPVLKNQLIGIKLQYSRLQKYILDLRNDINIVLSDGTLQKDVAFSSPTAAAQFVTGRSVNGYIAWRPDNKQSLKEYMTKDNTTYIEV
jgi:hypothetical protein